MLIHIGLDTVKLNGEYFKTHVKAGEKVKAGDLLLEFDRSAIEKEGYSLITPVVITNSDSYDHNTLCVDQEVKNGKAIINLKELSIQS